MTLDPLSHYGLVVHLARKRHASVQHFGLQIDLDDLVQEGLVGLLAAARRYDPDRGTAFSTFAYPFIKGAIENYVQSLELARRGGDQPDLPPPSVPADQEQGWLPQAVQHCLQAALEAVERQVLVLRMWEGNTLAEIGRIVGRPVQTVFNIELRSRRKMKDCLEGQGWELGDLGD